MLPLCASAVQIEAGVGIAHAAQRNNGIWYQQGFPYRLRLNQPAVELGLVQDISPHWAAHVDAVWLGRYASDSLDTPADANYNPKSPTHCNGPCLPLAHYVGHGGIGGVQALAEWHTAGSWRAGIEAGPFVYRSAWRLDVANWYPATAIAGGYARGPITPVHTRDSHWAVGFIVGFTVAHGPWSASLRWYHDGKGFVSNHIGIWPPIWKHHVALMIDRRFGA